MFLSAAATLNFFMLLNVPIILGLVQAKTLTLVIILFTVVVVFILCPRKSQLCFAFGKEQKTLICHLYYCFSGLHPMNYFSRKNC